MKGMGQMEFEIKDPLAKLLNIQIREVRDTGLTAQADIQPDCVNVYSAAHGGYLYTLGHITAALSTQFCLHRQAVVVDAANQHVRSLIKPRCSWNRCCCAAAGK